MLWYEMLLYWSEQINKDNISKFPGVVNQPLWLNLYSSFIQHGTLLIEDILNTDLKIPTLTHLNAKFNLEWQENTFVKLMSVIPIEWRTLIQYNTSTTFIQHHQLLYTAKSIKK